MSKVRDTFPSSTHYLEIDQDRFDAHFDRYPFKLRHHLDDHPLLQLPRLVELAQTRAGDALYFRGDHPINQVDDSAVSNEGPKRTFVARQLARPPLTAAETVAQIESASAWLQLRNVGTDPEYAILLSELIREFQPYAERVAPGLSVPRADIFVSSPGSRTPFHLDEEHNFLLQIRGQKQLAIADGFDPNAVAPGTLRDFFHSHGELARYSSHLEEHSVHVTLNPGEAVHIPPCHPHWVQNGPAVSVSLGILWFSDVTARRRHLYRVHGWLERAGLQPPEPGVRPTLDTVLALPVTLKRRVRRLLHRSNASFSGAPSAPARAR